MAKESMKAREVKRARLAAKYAERRAALKKIVNAAHEADDEKRAAAYEAAQQLQRLPKNSSPIRMHNRCSITAVPKAIARIRHLAYPVPAKWHLRPHPGVKKASW